MTGRCGSRSCRQPQGAGSRGTRRRTPRWRRTGSCCLPACGGRRVCPHPRLRRLRAGAPAGPAGLKQSDPIPGLAPALRRRRPRPHAGDEAAPEPTASTGPPAHAAVATPPDSLDIRKLELNSAIQLPQLYAPHAAGVVGVGVGVARAPE